jgi:hypothetical protein
MRLQTVTVARASSVVDLKILTVALQKARSVTRYDLQALVTARALEIAAWYFSAPPEKTGVL